MSTKSRSKKCEIYVPKNAEEWRRGRVVVLQQIGQVLRMWRETAGLSLEEATKRLNRNRLANQPAYIPDRLQKAEVGIRSDYLRKSVIIELAIIYRRQTSQHPSPQTFNAVNKPAVSQMRRQVARRLANEVKKRSPEQISRRATGQVRKQLRKKIVRQTKSLNRKQVRPIQTNQVFEIDEVEALIRELEKTSPYGHYFPTRQIRWAFRCLLSDPYMPRRLACQLEQSVSQVEIMAAFVEMYMRKSNSPLLLCPLERRQMLLRVFGEDYAQFAEWNRLSEYELRILVERLLRTGEMATWGASKVTDIIQEFDRLELSSLQFRSPPEMEDKSQITKCKYKYKLTSQLKKDLDRQQPGDTLRVWRLGQTKKDGGKWSILTLHQELKNNWGNSQNLPSTSTLEKMEKDCCKYAHLIPKLSKIYKRSLGEAELLEDEVRRLCSHEKVKRTPLFNDDFPCQQIRWAFGCLLNDPYLPRRLTRKIEELEPNIFEMAGFLEIYMHKQTSYPKVDSKDCNNVFSSLRKSYLVHKGASSKVQVLLDDYFSGNIVEPNEEHEKLIDYWKNDEVIGQFVKDVKKSFQSENSEGQKEWEKRGEALVDRYLKYLGYAPDQRKLFFKCLKNDDMKANSVNKKLIERWEQNVHLNELLNPSSMTRTAPLLLRPNERERVCRQLFGADYKTRTKTEKLSDDEISKFKSLLLKIKGREPRTRAAINDLVEEFNDAQFGSWEQLSTQVDQWFMVPWSHDYDPDDYESL